MEPSNGIPEQVVAKNKVIDFCEACLCKAGATPTEAKAVANVLTEADYRGHYSHGINRLPMYVKEIQTKICATSVSPKIIQESMSTAWVDGQNAFGPVVGNFCMDLAIAKAVKTGVGIVVAKGSNHYGIAGWYSMRACAKGFIGFSCTNSSPLMVPTRGKTALLGSNPIAMAAPGFMDYFALDMATTAVAVGKIEIAKRNGTSIPTGWAMDDSGRMTTDPFAAVSCMPLGGEEWNSGYKGYGLGLMVEILTGILSGGTMGPFVRRWMATDSTANLGQCFIAIDPHCFAPDFESRLSDLLSHLRGAASSDHDKRILIPGDLGRAHMELVENLGGIPYTSAQIAAMMEVAKDLQLDPIEVLRLDQGTRQGVADDE